MSKKSKILSISTIAAIAALGLSASVSVQAAKNTGMEKCYGVAKAKMNDCGNKLHSCAGQSKKAGSKDEWILVPKGLCNKLVGGSLGPSEVKKEKSEG